MSKEEGQNLLGIVLVCSCILLFRCVRPLRGDDQNEKIASSSDVEVLLTRRCASGNGVSLELPGRGCTGRFDLLCDGCSKVNELTDGR